MEQNNSARRNPSGATVPTGSGPSGGNSPASPTAASYDRDDEIARLRSRVAELQKERDHLVAVVDILQEVSASLHFVDILQSIARKLGDAFGLDRCTIFLAGEKDEVRLVASYEDPTLRNLVVDLNRYPELRRAFESKETVFIPDATNDPMLRAIKPMLDTRKVRSIVVVPIQWQGSVIGAIFLRTERDAEPFSDADVHFCQVVASLTAKALRNAHRFETLMRSQKGASEVQRKSELHRIALIAFVRRLLDRYATSEDHMWAETLLPKASDQELERLVNVAMQVIEEEAKG
jgi:transcriptional regulator with GAF, ATPase, and Fis domain